MSSSHRLLAAAVAALAALAGCGRTALDWVPEPPPDGGRTRALLARFAVIGDYGNDSADEARVARMVSGWNPDFIITTGDNNYPSGSAETIDANIGRHYERFIGNYHGAYGPGAVVNRFWPSPGNHDWDDGALAAYIDYFTLPGNERYYDVTIGPVHLFALDSDPREPDGNTEDSLQARWLEADAVGVVRLPRRRLLPPHRLLFLVARLGARDALAIRELGRGRHLRRP